MDEGYKLDRDEWGRVMDRNREYYGTEDFDEPYIPTEELDDVNTDEDIETFVEQLDR